MFGLAEEFINLEYYDKELWDLIIDTAIKKQKINNTHYFNTILNAFHHLNNNDKCTFHKTMQPKIDELLQRHYTEDRKWRYDADK